MEKVVSIKSKYKSDKYYVNFESELVHEISTDLLLKYKISIGTEFDDKQLKLILADQSLINARLSAYIFAAYKPRSEKQVRDKLRQLKYDEIASSQAMEYVREFKLLDDEKFANSFVKDYLMRKPSSKSKLKMELKIKGIDSEIIDKTILDFGVEDNQLNFALSSAEKKLKKISFKPKDKHKELVQSHLQREGFKYDLIKQVIEKIFPK